MSAKTEFETRCEAQFGGTWVEYKNRYSDAPHAFEYRSRIDRLGREVVAEYNPTGREVFPEQVDWVSSVRIVFLTEEGDLIDTSENPSSIPGMTALACTNQYQYKGKKV